MNTQILKYLALVPFVLACSDENNNPKPPTSSSEDLRSKTEEAHHAYLSRDYEKMLGQIKDVLQSPEAPAYMKENVMGLTEKAIQETRGELPVDWTVPDEIKKLRLNVERRDRGSRISHRFNIRWAELTQGLVKGVQVIKFPSEVILDKEANIGTMESQFEPEDNNFYASLDIETAKPIESGLYLIKMTLTNGKRVEGWFPLSNHVSLESPEVLSPAQGQTFATPTPFFKWKNFVSSLYQPHEFRHLSVYTARSEAPDYEWKEVSTFYEDDPTSTEMTHKPLEDGRYVNVVIFRESHRFGPITINRASSTSRHFHVKTK